MTDHAQQRDCFEEPLQPTTNDRSKAVEIARAASFGLGGEPRARLAVWLPKSTTCKQMFGFHDGLMPLAACYEEPEELEAGGWRIEDISLHPENTERFIDRLFEIGGLVLITAPENLAPAA